MKVFVLFAEVQCGFVRGLLGSVLRMLCVWAFFPPIETSFVVYCTHTLRCFVAHTLDLAISSCPPLTNRQLLVLCANGGVR